MRRPVIYIIYNITLHFVFVFEHHKSYFLTCRYFLKSSFAVCTKPCFPIYSAKQNCNPIRIKIEHSTHNFSQNSYYRITWIGLLVRAVKILRHSERGGEVSPIYHNIWQFFKGGSSHFITIWQSFKDWKLRLTVTKSIF